MTFKSERGSGLERVSVKKTSMKREGLNNVLNITFKLGIIGLSRAIIA